MGGVLMDILCTPENQCHACVVSLHLMPTPIYPQFTTSFEDISKQMRINANILMEEITKHANQEIERVRKECANAVAETAYYVEGK